MKEIGLEGNDITIALLKEAGYTTEDIKCEFCSHCKSPEIGVYLCYGITPLYKIRVWSNGRCNLFSKKIKDGSKH